jgi:hypothetical protein
MRHRNGLLFPLDGSGRRLGHRVGCIGIAAITGFCRWRERVTQLGDYQSVCPFSLEQQCRRGHRRGASRGGGCRLAQRTGEAIEFRRESRRRAQARLN